MQAVEVPPTWLARGDSYLTLGCMELLPKKVTIYKLNSE